LLPDAQIPPQGPSAPDRPYRRLAPWWHTAVLIAVLLSASLNGIRGRHPLAAHGKLPQYLWTIAWEWLLVGFVWLGIRKRIRLRDLIGGRWATAEDVVLDLVYASAFWFCALVVLGAGAKLMHMDRAGTVQEMRRQIGFLIPESRIELSVWFGLCLTAGFCEEVIFRGYLQRQFAAMGNSMLAGVLLSAAVFGASHGYEGAGRMILIGIYGLMFGLLAWWRKSLRTGMIAHAWHDAIAGAVLRMLH